jgi:hypothetical protein
MMLSIRQALGPGLFFSDAHSVNRWDLTTQLALGALVQLVPSILRTGTRVAQICEQIYEQPIAH